MPRFYDFFYMRFGKTSEFPVLKNIHVFPQFLVYHPWNSNDFYSTPWNFPLISSKGGLQFFFLEKPILKAGLPLEEKSSLDTQNKTINIFTFLVDFLNVLLISSHDALLPKSSLALFHVQTSLNKKKIK